MTLSTVSYVERWTLAKPFIIARGTETAFDLIVVELEDGPARGRGECCPVPHFGESTASVMAQIETMLSALREGRDWDDLHDLFPAGAARNAVDCATWDLRAKRAGCPVSELLGIPDPQPVETVFTISMNAPEVMADAARAASDYPLLKLKLGGPGDADRVAAVRAARPEARLIADANEGWDTAMLQIMMEPLRQARIEMIEQPLPAGKDEIVVTDRTVLIGADESCHVAADVPGLARRYDLINIKLDKSGGLTEAMRMLDAAEAHGLQTMVGCMLGTSLAMAPALLVAQRCRYADLDAPLLIGSDRDPALRYARSTVSPPVPALWG